MAGAKELLLVAGACLYGMTRSRTQRMAFDPRFEAGSMEMMGGYFDPAGFMRADSGKWKDEDVFRSFRTAELKHGRVAMLAAVGLLVQPYWRFEGFQDVRNDWSALDSGAGGAFGALCICAGIMEGAVWKQDPAKAVGDFSDATKQWIQPFPQISAPPTEEDKRSLQDKELNNGRLAMSAVITNLIFTATTGQSTMEQVENISLVPAQFAPVLLLFVLNALRENLDKNYAPLGEVAPKQKRLNA